MPENQQETIVSTDEVDTVGGWLVKHFTRTTTWDVRYRLDALQEELAKKQAVLASVQKEVDDLQAAITIKDTKA